MNKEVDITSIILHKHKPLHDFVMYKYLSLSDKSQDKDFLLYNLSAEI